MRMIVYQPPTLANRMAHKRMIRQMGADVIPQDKSWQVLLLFAACVIGMTVLSVRWWLCV